MDVYPVEGSFKNGAHLEFKDSTELEVCLAAYSERLIFALARGDEVPDSDFEDIEDLEELTHDNGPYPRAAVSPESATDLSEVLTEFASKTDEVIREIAERSLPYNAREVLRRRKLGKTASVMVDSIKVGILAHEFSLDIPDTDSDDTDQ